MCFINFEDKNVLLDSVDLSKIVVSSKCKFLRIFK